MVLTWELVLGFYSFFYCQWESAAPPGAKRFTLVEERIGAIWKETSSFVFLLWKVGIGAFGKYFTCHWDNPRVSAWICWPYQAGRWEFKTFSTIVSCTYSKMCCFSTSWPSSETQCNFRYIVLRVINSFQVASVARERERKTDELRNEKR